MQSRAFLNTRAFLFALRPCTPAKERTTAHTKLTYAWSPPWIFGAEMQGPQIFPKKRGPDPSLDQAVWRKTLSSGGTCLLSTGAVCQDKNLTEKPTVRILTGSTCHPFASKANER